MTRAALLPFAVVAFLWFLLRCRIVVRGWLCALLAFLGFANGLAPWTVRNWQNFQDVIPITDSAQAYLWAGNHPNATGGPPTALDWNEPRGALSNRERPKRYEELGSLAQTEIMKRPVATVHRRLAAGLYFFFGKSWIDSRELAAQSSEDMPEWLSRSYPGALAGSLLGMLVLGVLGWRWTYGWRFSAMPSSLAVMWIPLPYILAHADILSGPRLPLDGVLLCYAAFAVGCLTPRLSEALLAGERLAPRNEVVVRTNRPR